ncbi:MAG: AI-2E family transporter [Thermomicrobiales bacterium]|nr:AI-2E family transporter [Thermomicrobiales bacterium]
MDEFLTTPVPENPAGLPPDQSWLDRGRSLSPISLLLVILIAYFMIEVKGVLILIVLSFLFATIIERPVNRLQRQHLPRALSILVVYTVIIAMLGAATYLLVPTIAEEAERFRTEAPESLRELQRDWRTSDNGILRGPGADGLQSLIAAIQKPPEIPQEVAIPVITGITGGVIGFVTIFVITFYYLMEKPFTQRLILMQLKPPTALRVGRIWADVEQQLGRWMRGQLTLMIIIGIASTVAYGLLDIRFWPVLGLIAGITEAIPIIGPWLGGIPAVAVAMTQSWEKALMVAGVAVAIQLTENWILVPRVMRGAVGLTPLTVFLAILVGTEFMGVVGALLAIPIAAAIQVIVSDLIKARRAEDQLPQTVSSWRWLGERLMPERDPWSRPPPASQAQSARNDLMSERTPRSGIVWPPQPESGDVADADSGIARATE